MSLSSVAVSAPGKVLFAGGFLVLDRQHTGLVFGLNARIHAAIQQWTNPSHKLIGTHILVQSPQFLDARWLYRIKFGVIVDEDLAITVEQICDQEDQGFTTTSNKFVETTLRYVLTYLCHSMHGSNDVYKTNVKVTILADNDYYSQPQSMLHLSNIASTTVSESNKSEFASFGVKLSDAHKTGLAPRQLWSHRWLQDFWPFI